MSKTYADIEDRVLKNINSTTADVSIAIDNAIDFLGNFYENKLIDASIATVASQDYIARPDLCKEVERLEIAGVEYKKASISEINELVDYALQRFVEYDGKINIYPTPTAIQTTKIWFKANFTPLAGVAGAVSDVPDELIPLLVSIATWFFLEQQENQYDYTGSDGWIAVNDAWTFSNDVDTPIFEVTVPAGATSKYQAGMRIKFTQTSVKYFLIVKVTNTKLYLYGGTDYVLTNAIISQISFSTAKVPFGFPIDPSKWTEVATDITERIQLTPVQDTWYNLGSFQLSIPLGLWDVTYEVMAMATDNSAGVGSIVTTLSTTNNTETDPEFSAMYYGSFTGATVNTQIHAMRRNKLVNLAATAIHYLNTRVTGMATLDTFKNQNNFSTAIIKAVCAYL